jgi:hypothetical protein
MIAESAGGNAADGLLAMHPSQEAPAAPQSVGRPAGPLGAAGAADDAVRLAVRAATHGAARPRADRGAEPVRGRALRERPRDQAREHCVRAPPHTLERLIPPVNSQTAQAPRGANLALLSAVFVHTLIVCGRAKNLSGKQKTTYVLCAPC